MPVVHEALKKEKLTTDGKEQCTRRQLMKGFENAIETEIVLSHKSLYILLCSLLFSGLAVGVYLSHPYSSVSACHLTVNLLNIKVNKLMVEVNVLSNHLSSLLSHRGHYNHLNSKSDIFHFTSFLRQKRDTKVCQSTSKGSGPCKETEAERIGVQQAAHFKGAHPEALVEAGRVGPWWLDTKAAGKGEVSSLYQLKQDMERVEIKESGLYFIYAQVYYLTT